MENRFSGHGLVIGGLSFLSPREALPFLKNDAVLVDLREDHEKNGREFEVAHRIGMRFAELPQSYEKLPRDVPLILADCVGLKSKEGVQFLIERGYASVASLNGGMVDWERDGMPTAVDRDEELTGQCACKLRPRKSLRSGC